MDIRSFRPGLAILALALFLPALAHGQMAADEPRITYHVQVTGADFAADAFRVRIHVTGEPLGAGNAILQFASTAPGTYQVMDVGRFVRDLVAFDREGAPLAVERVSTNQWRVSDPARLGEVRYTIAETWDTTVEEHPIYPMAGTSIEPDHVLFNAHAVIPHVQGLQDAPTRLDFGVPPGWTVGTALQRDAAGFYAAEDYDHLVDSPVLAGNDLTVATTTVGGADIEIYTYSATDGIRSDMLLEGMEAMLQASAQFLDGLPVDRYVFLYHFETVHGRRAYGAWEHSYSSEYTMPDLAWSEGYANALKDIAAHEFLHIVTPLNIHSEIIEHFDFETPVPSRHLWLYEGVTEWGSHMSQLRAGIKSLEAYLEEQAQKIGNERANYDATYPLETLALTSYTPEGQAQYGNIYQRGAIVAGLLDIRLLELSGGEMDLQDVLLELMERYGPSRPFDDAELHDVIVEMTFPEIGEFFESFVVGAEPLPIGEYYAKIGIEYDAEGPAFTVMEDATAEQVELREAWMESGRLVS